MKFKIIKEGRIIKTIVEVSEIENNKKRKQKSVKSKARLIREENKRNNVVNSNIMSESGVNTIEFTD